MRATLKWGGAAVLICLLLLFAMAGVMTFAERGRLLATILLGIVVVAINLLDLLRCARGLIAKRAEK